MGSAMYSPNLASGFVHVSSHAPGRSPGSVKGLGQMQEFPCSSGHKAKGDLDLL